MPIIRNSFLFIVGTAWGIYVSQNYNAPNIKKFIGTGLVMAKHVEKAYRKPNKREDDNNL